MFRVKICGITTVADAEATVAAGADCIGLNFYRASTRFVDVTQAQTILNVSRGRVLSAGVFVDALPETIAEITSRLDLDLVQLSGNDSPAMLGRLSALLGDVPIMQAVRLGPNGIAAVESHFEECRRLNCLPRLILWDAYDAARFGGTGRTADWASAAQCVAGGAFPPLVLAGGLRLENVAEAIGTVHPHGVDTASGVESRPGVKDPISVKAFVAAARAAFDNEPAAD
jgi:phosphoribosylanthranilate isomerase